MLIDRMNLFDLTVNQLKRATAIKEQIEALNDELHNILGGSSKSVTATRKKRAMSAFGKRGRVAKPAVKTATKPKKKVFSAATRAKLSAKLKAYWAAKRAGKK